MSEGIPQPEFGALRGRTLPGFNRRVVSVVGTRPEAIKMAPVVRALTERPWIEQRIILTGQHEELGLCFDFLPPSCLEELEIDRRGLSVDALCDTIRSAIRTRLSSEWPDIVLVQGDTTSALAGALAAGDLGITLGHVEAGLRSFDLDQPWPEEGNRIAIDRMSDLLFAPTADAAGNLRSDAQVSGAIHVTGNSGIDALFHARAVAMPAAPPPENKMVLVTCHRKENRGEGMRQVCAALKRLVRELDLEVVVPLHPNRHVRAELEAWLRDIAGIKLLEPVDHREMVMLMERSWLILTDSGGLQEEGPALGKPVLVLRNVTERPEALASESIRLVGTETGTIVAEVAALLSDESRYARMSVAAFPFGRGDASPRIAAAVEDWLLYPSKISGGVAAAV